MIQIAGNSSEPDSSLFFVNGFFTCSALRPACHRVVLECLGGGGETLRQRLQSLFFLPEETDGDGNIPMGDDPHGLRTDVINLLRQMDGGRAFVVWIAFPTDETGPFQLRQGARHSTFG